MSSIAVLFPPDLQFLFLLTSSFSSLPIFANIEKCYLLAVGVVPIGDLDADDLLREGELCPCPRA